MKFSKLNRIYINYPLTTNETLILDGDFVHYLKNVLKAKVGEQIRIFNSIDGESLAQIVNIAKNTITVQLIKVLRKIEPEIPLVLGICLIKNDKLLLAINMAVQLGVTEIIPIIAERSSLRVINSDRINKCIIEATEQSERLIPPKLGKVATLKEFGASADLDMIIYANEQEAKENSIKKIASLAGKVAYIVGPEGGFSSAELEMMSGWKQARSVSLGDSVLRAETAVAAGLAQIQLYTR